MAPWQRQPGLGLHPAHRRRCGRRRTTSRTECAVPWRDYSTPSGALSPFSYPAHSRPVCPLFPVRGVCRQRNSVRESGWQTERRCYNLLRSGHLRPSTAAPTVCYLDAQREEQWPCRNPLSRHLRSWRTAHGLTDRTHSAGTVRSPKPQVAGSSPAAPASQFRAVSSEQLPGAQRFARFLPFTGSCCHYLDRTAHEDLTVYAIESARRVALGCGGSNCLAISWEAPPVRWSWRVGERCR